MGVVWRGLGEVMIAAHYAFLLYLLVGGILAWWWPRTIAPHVVAAIWGILIIVTKVPCPLTALQNNFRERGGQAPYAKGFIDHYVRGQLYPTSHEGLVQVLVAAVVLVSWFGLAARTRQRGPIGSATS